MIFHIQRYHAFHLLSALTFKNSAITGFYYIFYSFQYLVTIPKNIISTYLFLISQRFKLQYHFLISVFSDSPDSLYPSFETCKKNVPSAK